MLNIAVLGATTWGNTISHLLMKKGFSVKTWAKTEAMAKQLNTTFKKTTAEIEANGSLEFTSRIDEALESAVTVVFGISAQGMRQTAKQASTYIKPDMILVSLAKGLEANSCKRMSEVIQDEINIPSEHICILSGPNLSQEINRGLPSTSVLANINPIVAESERNVFNSINFAVFTSTDVVGVELCGALKNVIALGAGMVDGLGLGDNAKATLITFGWNEVILLGTALGARNETFWGLAGLGDLITTSAGSLSRNHYVGREIASGRPLTEVKASMKQIAEGIDTTAATHRLAHKLGVNIPIIDLIYRVLYQAIPPVEITNRFKYGLKSQ